MYLYWYCPFLHEIIRKILCLFNSQAPKRCCPDWLSELKYRICEIYKPDTYLLYHTYLKNI